MRETPEIQVQPLNLAIHSGSTMLVTDLEGWIDNPQTGLFAHDTRYLSTYAVTIEGFKPTFLTAERPAYNCAITSYTNPKFRAATIAVDEFALSLKISRIIDEGLHEVIEVTNFACHPVRFRLVINLECSFDDIFEVRGLHRSPPRVARFHYDAASSTVNCSYRDRNFSRCLEYQIISSDTSPRYSPNLLIFRLDLDHEQSWHAEIVTRMKGQPLGQFFSSTVTSPSGEARAMGSHEAPAITVTERLRAGHLDVARWGNRLPRLQTSNQIVDRAYA